VAYQTGTASSPIDLLQKIVTWLTSIGWTSDMSAADGAGWRAHLHKGTNYVHLRAQMNEGTIWQQGNQYGYGLHLYLSSAFNGSAAWNAQPGNPPVGNGTAFPVGVGALLVAGPIQNYYFFSDVAADNVILVIEKTAGVYVHVGWGLSMTKCGTWTGGAYFFGSMSGYWAGYYPGPSYHPSPGINDSSSCPGADGDWWGPYTNFFVRCDVDAFTGKWLGVSNNQYPPYGYTGKFCRSSVFPMESTSSEYNIALYLASSNYTSTYDFQTCQTSAADGRTNLLPPLIWGQRDIGEFSLLGSIPNIFSSNGVGNGFSNTSEYVIGTTTYKMFPNFAVIKQ
jgi:hypothetical protein